MVMYTSENSGWLPGSGWTTGAMFFDFRSSPPAQATGLSVSNSPGLNEPLDWIGPLARMVGYGHDKIITGNDDLARYSMYRTLPWVICPGSRGMPVGAKTAGSNDVGEGQGISYCTSMAFLDVPLGNLWSNCGWEGLAHRQSNSTYHGWSRLLHFTTRLWSQNYQGG